MLNFLFLLYQIQRNREGMLTSSILENSFKVQINMKNRTETTCKKSLSGHSTVPVTLMLAGALAIAACT